MARKMAKYIKPHCKRTIANIVYSVQGIMSQVKEGRNNSYPCHAMNRFGFSRSYKN